jgi:uncharacterized membrane protein
VVRDKLRVLFLCGQPGPEYAFLRAALKNDPLIELVSFVILRNPENIALVSDEDLALIPFPVQAIFTKDIYNFDILILENFTHRRFGFYPEYLANIRSWITQKGGGLVMTGGENSFASGGWDGTPVGEILPVNPEKDVSSWQAEGLFKLYAEDLSHPIMTVDDDPAKNAETWRNAPELDGCQAVTPKQGAKVLAARKPGGWAVVTAWDAGKGRVTAVGSNTTWRWALQADSPDLYARFWKNVMRYTARKAGEKKLFLSFDRPEYYEGQDFELRIRAAEKQESAGVTVTVTGPDGSRTTAQARKTGEKGWVFNGRFSKSGEYRFTAALTRGGVSVFETARAQGVSASTMLEETALDNNDASLESAASLSGGRYFTKESFSASAVAPLLKAAKRAEDGGRKQLWDSPWLLALIAASIIGELLMRRMRGLF